MASTTGVPNLRLPFNFHHLHYFWAVARTGNLTKAAQLLRVSQSALSAQIRQLELHLGHELFAREGRRLVLTETGLLALPYADAIFAAGDELASTLRQGRKRQQVLRVGAVATLSKNFQQSFVAPVLEAGHARLSLKSGSFDELLLQLSAHELDVVLANHPAPASFISRRLARQPVSLVSSKPRAGFRFPRGLEGEQLILPGPGSELRREFDALAERLKVKVRVLAEVDDMASMRLLASESSALVLVPSVVVRDELRLGSVVELCTVPDLFETFYALTAPRRFPHPLVEALVSREDRALLEPQPG